MRLYAVLLLIATSAQAESVSFQEFLAEKSFESVEIRGLAEEKGRSTLHLERFDPIAADAQFVVVEDNGEKALGRPDSHFYRGHASGGAPAFLAVHSNGDYYGIVRDPSGTRIIAPAGEGFELKRVESSQREPFQCDLHDHARLSAPGAAELPSFAAQFPEGVLYNARVAIDTDQEYLARFSGNTTNATNYLTTLIGYLSTIYSTGADTQLQLSFSRLWTTTDPWAQSDTACMLLEVGKYWNDNMTAQVRSVMHFVSGKPSLAGIAWVGVVCSGQFDTSPDDLGVSCPGISGTSNYGGAYGVTSGVEGDFNPGNPVVVWDSLAVAHEIGHNFNSPHTHCYGNLGGNPNPVDQCYNGEGGQPGCHTGPEVLPGSAGTGSGTIMSYCHLLSPGESNITMTFGEGHGFGVVPARVNQRMRTHVAQRAAANPSCLALPSNPNIFANGFE